MSNKENSIPVNRTLSTPAEFRELIANLQQLLRDGRLVQAAVEDPIRVGVDLRTLPLDGPWPDIVEAEFTDHRGYRYHLFVDTYHGSGGAWTRTE